MARFLSAAMARDPERAAGTRPGWPAAWSPVGETAPAGGSPHEAVAQRA
jgi:hypothetical protein